MAKPRELPSAEYLHSCFTLDVETGELRWKWRDDVPRWVNAKYTGEVAGSLDKRGYHTVRVKGRDRKAHRVIWKMVTGKDPVGEIDHWHGVGEGNSPGNLRDATHAQNISNYHRSGRLYPCGVYPVGRRFAARIKNRHLGTRDTPEEAHGLYLKAANEIYGEFAFHNRPHSISAT